MKSSASVNHRREALTQLKTRLLIRAVCRTLLPSGKHAIKKMKNSLTVPAAEEDGMITIVDYDAGNIKSVEKALQYIGAQCVITRDTDFISAADKVIVPA